MTDPKKVSEDVEAQDLKNEFEENFCDGVADLKPVLWDWIVEALAKERATKEVIVGMLKRRDSEVEALEKRMKELESQALLDIKEAQTMSEQIASLKQELVEVKQRTIDEFDIRKLRESELAAEKDRARKLVDSVNEIKSFTDSSSVKHICEEAVRAYSSTNSGDKTK